MHIFEAKSQVIFSLRNEAEMVTTREHADFKVHALHHLTLGNLVVIEGKDGSGFIVETELTSRSSY